jgi:FkbM family methyltransferase
VTFVDVSRRVRHLRGLQEQTWLWAIVRVPYHGLLRGLSRTRGVSRLIDDESYRWRYPFSEFDAEFEEPVFETFRSLLRPGMTVFDIGANFGLYAVVAGKTVGKQGKVYAFEPATVRETLADHIRLNGVQDRVEVVPMIVTDEPGEAELWEPEDGRLASLSQAAAERNQSSTAHVERATTVDAFCEARSVVPDVVKIDVEGAEANVLRGARRFLERRHGTLIIEVHPWVLSDLGENEGQLFDELRRHGWAARQLFERGDASDRFATVHYLCTPNGNAQ